MKKILITGGDGQLSKQLFLELSNNFEVISLSKKDLNITDKKNVKSILSKYNPEIVINSAAYTNVDGCETNSKLAYDVNANAINNFRDFFNGFFIQISTDYVFDGENGPYNESSKTNPLGIYGKSKFQGEEIVRDNFKNHLIIRTNVLFGGKSKANFLDWVIESLLLNNEINVVDDQYNNPVSVYDLSKTIHNLIYEESRGIIHVGSDTLCSRFEFANMIADCWNLNNNYIKPISTQDLSRKIKNYIAPRPLKSGLISLNKYLPTLSLKNSLKNIKNQKN